jgi:hypothetical protein
MLFFRSDAIIVEAYSAANIVFQKATTVQKYGKPRLHGTLRRLQPKDFLSSLHTNTQYHTRPVHLEDFGSAKQNSNIYCWGHS